MKDFTKYQVWKHLSDLSDNPVERKFKTVQDLAETKKNLKRTIKVKPHMFTFVRGVKYILFTNDDLVINHCESLKKSRNWKVMDAKKKIVNDGAEVPRYEIIDSKIQ